MKTRFSMGWASAERRGAVAVIVALSMILLVGILALVLDGGLLLVERRETQAAADAAALAASIASHQNAGDLDAARAAAVSFASANGFPDGGSSTVTLNSPPLAGRYAGQDSHIEVVVTSAMPRLFSGIWGSEDVGVTSRAVARRGGDPAAALILLDPSRSGALELHGSARIVTDQGIHVNSNHPTAVIATNTGHTRPATPGKPGVPVIKIGGNYTTSSGGYLLGTIQTNAPPVADPMAHVPTPPQAGPTHNLESMWGWTWQQNRTLNPGIYDGPLGVTLRGGNGQNFTMNPGLYYIRQGNFTVEGGTRLTGHGVTIFLHQNGQINLQGGSQTTLSPPTQGTYQGLSIFVDRSSTQQININNGTNNVITGTIYAPNNRIHFAGGTQVEQYGSAFIARSMRVDNNAYVRIGGEDTAGDSNFKLVE